MKALDLGEAEKASAFLWGSVAQALKAVAVSKDISLMSHAAIRSYARKLAKTLQDETILHAFEHAQSLHSNFYETGLLLEDVAISADEVRAFLAKLFKLIPTEKDPSDSTNP
ncbi:MAG: hypothetical protein HY667_05175 [Chloroflexi bacterium]|nr:hypothetical protein [Chloroflexota bacterium]